MADCRLVEDAFNKWTSYVEQRRDNELLADAYAAAKDASNPPGLAHLKAWQEETGYEHKLKDLSKAVQHDRRRLLVKAFGALKQETEQARSDTSFTCATVSSILLIEGYFSHLAS